MCDGLATEMAMVMVMVMVAGDEDEVDLGTMKFI